MKLAFILPIRAAGADVLITYAGGQSEAELVAAEIREGGGRCATMCLDVTELHRVSALAFEKHTAPTEFIISHRRISTPIEARIGTTRYSSG